MDILGIDLFDIFEDRCANCDKQCSNKCGIYRVKCVQLELEHYVANKNKEREK